MAATGSLSFGANPAAGDSITIDGTQWTFVSSGAVGDETDIGGSLSATLGNLSGDLNSSSLGTNVTFGVSGAPSNTLTMTYNTDNLAGNSFTFAGITPANSGATLTGGATTANAGGSATAGMTGGSAAIDQTTNNTWSVELYANPPSDVTGTSAQLAYGTVAFNGDGTLSSISPDLTQPVAIDWSNPKATAGAVAFNWGTAGPIAGTPNATVVGLSNGLEQLDSAYNVTANDHNGTPSGVGATVSISSGGVVSATYSDGTVRNLYQIPLAQFTNADQLQALSANVYKPSTDSGTLTFFSPGEEGTAKIDTSSLEQSNVDLAAQLTNMIIAQNAYQANTKTISTSDQMLQTLTNMDQSISV
jgi:flagellar hook protein FlgE